MYRRLGAQVTVLEVVDRSVACEYPEVSTEVQAILEREGVRFLFGVRNARVERRGNQIHVSCAADGATHELTASHLLAAVGQRPSVPSPHSPSTRDLGLQAA